MAHIHWYPGHIAKAQKELKEKLNLIDVIIEVIDARIPYSSRYKNAASLCLNKPRLILMNKSDLSDEKYNKIWAQTTEKATSCEVFPTDIQSKKDIKKIIEKVNVLTEHIMKKREEKGLLRRCARTMVIGMPNVGKSSTINRLAGKSKAKTGAKAGVTKKQQWVRINDKIELLDTPGIISAVQDDQYQALKLALVNSIGSNAYDSEFIASELIKILDKRYKKEMREYFGFGEDEEINLENIALKRKYLQKEGKPDTKRTSEIILSNFREGKIGRFTLEIPEEYNI